MKGLRLSQVLGLNPVLKLRVLSQGPISQRDLSPDLGLNLDFGLKFCQKTAKPVVLDLADFTKQLSP